MGLVFMLTKGGPAGKTETLSYYIYVMGLQLFHVGLAAATSSRPAPAPAALCPVIVDYRDSRAMAWLGQHVGLPPDTTQCPASDSTTLNWTQPKPQVMRSTGG